MNQLFRKNEYKFSLTVLDKETQNSFPKSFFRNSVPDVHLFIGEHSVMQTYEFSQEISESKEDTVDYYLNHGDIFTFVLNYFLEEKEMYDQLDKDGIAMFDTAEERFIDYAVLLKTSLEEQSGYIKGELAKKPSNHKPKALKTDDIIRREKDIRLYSQMAMLYFYIHDTFEPDRTPISDDWDESERLDMIKTFLMSIVEVDPFKFPKDPLHPVIDSHLFRSNFKNTVFLNEMTVTMQFNETASEITYRFYDFLDLIIFDMYQMLQQEKMLLKRCENCGKYFFPATRSDEIYCENIFRNGKTCKQLGYEIKVESNTALKAYRTIYKTQNARKQRNKKNIPNIDDKFAKWAKSAKKELQRCQNNEFDTGTLKERISSDSWMFE